MKFDALIRMFRGPLPSDPPHFAEMLAELKEIANRMNVDTTAPLPSTTRIANYPGPTETPTPEPNSLSWVQWAREMAVDGQHPGWAYCRFGNRGQGESGGPERCVLVHGYVRSAFGVWERDFEVCSPRIFASGEVDYEQSSTERRKLASITHLLSGIGLGVFASLPLAMEAAELAEAVHPRWFTDLEATDEGYRRTGRAWAAASIVPAWDSHAHQPGGAQPNLPIYSRANILAGKPEVLAS